MCPSVLDTGLDLQGQSLKQHVCIGADRLIGAARHRDDDEQAIFQSQEPGPKAGKMVNITSTGHKPTTHPLIGDDLQAETALRRLSGSYAWGPGHFPGLSTGLGGAQAGTE